MAVYKEQGSFVDLVEVTITTSRTSIKVTRGKEKRGQHEEKGNGCKKQRREHDDDEEADAADTTEESSYNPKKAKGNNGNRVSQARGGPYHQVSQNKPCISTSVEMQEAIINMTNSHNHSINEECTLLCSQEASRRKKGRSEPSRPAKMIPPHDESMTLGVDACDPNLTAYSLPLFNPMLLAVHEMPPIKVDIFDDPLKSKKKGGGGSNKTNVDDNTSSDNGMIDTSSRTLFRGDEDDNGVDNLAHCSKVFHPPLYSSNTGIYPLTHPLPALEHLLLTLHPSPTHSNSSPFRHVVHFSPDPNYFLPV